MLPQITVSVDYLHRWVTACEGVGAGHNPTWINPLLILSVGINTTMAIVFLFLLFPRRAGRSQKARPLKHHRYSSNERDCRSSFQEKERRIAAARASLMTELPEDRITFEEFRHLHWQSERGNAEARSRLVRHFFIEGELGWQRIRCTGGDKDSGTGVGHVYMASCLNGVLNAGIPFSS